MLSSTVMPPWYAELDVGKELARLAGITSRRLPKRVKGLSWENEEEILDAVWIGLVALQVFVVICVLVKTVVGLSRPKPKERLVLHI